MQRTQTTELSDKVQVGDIIRPFQGKDEQGRPYTPSGFGELTKSRDTSVAYIVEEARMAGGGYGHGPHDYYPDGWQVTARRLALDCTYNPRAKTIRFYQSGCFIDTIKQVPVIGKMRKTFLPEEKR